MAPLFHRAAITSGLEERAGLRTATDEIEAQEHRQREYEIDRYAGAGDRLAVGVLHLPREVERPGHRVNATDEQLDDDLNARPQRDGHPPVTDAVVDHEHLQPSSPDL